MIKVFRDQLNGDLCKEFVKELQSCEYEKMTAWVEDGIHSTWHTMKRHEELMMILHFSLADYIDELNVDYFTGWNGYSKPRYNRYTKDVKMKMHCDHIHSLFTSDEDPEPKGVPILSMVGLLNDDFTGGEFIIGEKNLNLTSGDVVVFPSNFMFPHKVNTINNGERYSFVSWVW